MKNKWTNFNSILIILSIIVCLIGVLILSIQYSSVIIFILGIIIVAISHAVWGLLIEISKNILLLAPNKINRNDNSQTTVPTMGNDCWKCNKCSTANPNTYGFCQNCGNQKNETNNNLEEQK